MKLEENLKLVKKNIEAAKERVGLKNHVEIIAATKTRDLSIIKKCFDLGITTIGENRIQEAEKKFSNFSGFEKIKKRFIGHLQKNKVNKCLSLFDAIDSVDSYRLAKKINTSFTFYIFSKFLLVVYPMQSSCCCISHSCTQKYM